MPVQTVTPADWKTIVTERAARLTDRTIADALMRFELLPQGPYAAETGATAHHGSLTIEGDFAAPSQVVVVDGDLTVSGKLSTDEVEGDGQVSLVVFGDLRCGSVDHSWGSILFVTGDMIVEDWVFAAREDSALVVGGDFRTPIFIGADKWVAAGGTVAMDYGYGYAVALAWFADAYGAPQIHPAHGWRELAVKLGMGGAGMRDEEDFLQLAETRLFESGTPYG